MKTACLPVITTLFMLFSLGMEVTAQNGTPPDEPERVNGAIGLDTRGVIRTVSDDTLSDHPLFQVDENFVPTQFDIFFLGFDAFRDMETIANDQDRLSGVIGLDKFAGVHTYTVPDPQTVTGPQIDYGADIAAYNAANPDEAVQLPYFPFEIPIETENDGVGRDLELVTDWRSATNAFQGYYILDAYAGVHYVNNAQVMSFLQNNPGEVGVDRFFDIFNFKPIYLNDYAGQGDDGPNTKDAPYFLFSGNSGLPIAKDLEVMVRFQELTVPDIVQSRNRRDIAASNGITADGLFQPIEIEENRAQFGNPRYAPSVAITNGYAILDGFGAVHTIIEDRNGNPIPAPWESTDDGLIDPTVDAPYFATPPFEEGGDDFDIAIDVEIMPNGQGYLLLTRLGEVFVVNAPGSSPSDNFVTPGIERQIPIFGFDAARDLEVVANQEGKIVGLYVVDRFGTVHRAGRDIPQLSSETLFFPSGFANKIELSPYTRPVTGPSY